MSQILSQLAGNQLAGFILVLARVSPLFLLAPPFSSPIIPPRVRGIVAVGIAIGFAPIALHGQQIPSGPVALGALAIENILVGLGFAFSFAVLFAAIEAAGSLADLGAGFSYGSLINPLNGEQGSVLSHLYSLFGIAVFLIVDGEAWLFKGLARTFALVPLTSAPRISSLYNGVEQVFSTVFLSALEIAAPVLIALLITDVAFGVVSRVVPQFNVFAVGFPAKVAVALLMVGASLPFVAGWISNQMSTSVGSALGAMHVG